MKALRRILKYKTYWQYGLLILGMSISAILVILFPNFYHHSDIRELFRWAKYWNEGWENIYINCPECNYPILGMFSSAGLLNLLGGEGSRNVVWFFRFILAIVDGINVLLIFLLLKEFSIKNAALWAGIVGLLFSSWAGGALWGQIDNISQFFILLTLLWIVTYNISIKIPFIIYLGICSLLMACMLLTKQLTLFSLVSLELLVVVNIIFHRKKVSIVGYTIFQFALLCIFVFLWDPFLHLPKPYLSHLQLIWSSRSVQGDILAANGFNIWIFLHRGIGSSSYIPFLILSKYYFSTLLTPYNIGIFIFLTLLAIITISTLFNLRKHYGNGDKYLNREVLLNFILHLTIINLGFNVLLTGTHERYLYHFYPIIILACLGLREYDKIFSRKILVLLLIGSSLYGSFVLGILSGIMEKYISIFGYNVHKGLAIYHAVLLIILIIITLKYQEVLKNIKLLFGRM